MRRHELNALPNMEGCEPASNLSGGMILLTNTSQGWKKIGYMKGYRFEDCMKFPSPEGFRYLLCRQSSQVQDTLFGTVYWISLENGTFAATPLLRWVDNLGSNPRHLLSVFPNRFFRSDFNQDGRGDVRIDIKIRNEEFPSRYAGAIDAINAGFKPAEPEMIQLTYLFDGAWLKLLGENEPGLKRLTDVVDNYRPLPPPLDPARLYNPPVVRLQAALAQHTGEPTHIVETPVVPPPANGAQAPVRTSGTLWQH